MWPYPAWVLGQCVACARRRRRLACKHPLSAAVVPKQRALRPHGEELAVLAEGKHMILESLRRLLNGSVSFTESSESGEGSQSLCIVFHGFRVSEVGRDQAEVSNGTIREAVETGKGREKTNTTATNSVYVTRTYTYICMYVYAYTCIHMIRSSSHTDLTQSVRTRPARISLGTAGILLSKVCTASGRRLTTIQGHERGSVT